MSVRDKFKTGKIYLKQFCPEFLQVFLVKWTGKNLKASLQNKVFLGIFCVYLVAALSDCLELVFQESRDLLTAFSSTSVSCGKPSVCWQTTSLFWRRFEKTSSPGWPLETLLECLQFVMRQDVQEFWIPHHDMLGFHWRHFFL